VDDLLEGGLPIGAISEFVGPESSGRTSLALSFLAGATRTGKVGAWIDVCDELDPESAAAAGVDLAGLLWVRCGVSSRAHDARDGLDLQGAGAKQAGMQAEAKQGLKPASHSAGLNGPAEALPLLQGAFQVGEAPASRTTESHEIGKNKEWSSERRATSDPSTPPSLRSGSAQDDSVSASVAVEAGQFRLPEKYMIPPPVKKGLHGGGFGPHPRTEVKGLSEAVSELLRPEVIAARCAESQPRPQREREAVGCVSPKPAAKANGRVRAGKPWARIEQALRVTDLLLQGGGFAAIVLDMGGIAAEYATRVPLATWFRYRAAAERAQTSLLLLTTHPCAKSSGELLLRFQPGRPCGDEATVFTGIEHHVEVDRRRFTQTPANVVSIRKPPQRETGAKWRSRSTWAGAR
jgi:hypothetical protein